MGRRVAYGMGFATIWRPPGPPNVDMIDMHDSLSLTHVYIRETMRMRTSSVEESTRQGRPERHVVRKESLPRLQTSILDASLLQL